MVKEVEVSKKAKKQLRKLPSFVLKSFFVWVASIETKGLMETRRVGGYNDEALRGKLKGLRSVRMNDAYRAYYVVEDRKRDDKIIKVVFVERVDKHEY